MRLRIRRLPVLDELVRDGEMVVLLDDRALLMSPLASAALEMLQEAVWTSDDDLGTALVARFGPVDDPDQAVFALVSELLGAGLVEIDGA